MPPAVILDPESLDFSRIIAGHEEIAHHNPQRHEFALLDAIVYVDDHGGVFAGYHDLTTAAWWTRAHIPGRPLFPGVLMIEVGAQLASFITHYVLKDTRFIGFTGADEVKFRGTVEPPCRFVIVGKAIEVRPRRTICQLQGFVNNIMVFEGQITGMLV